MHLTRHASAQMQQRGISETAVGYLIAWGSRAHDHRGATIRYFDKTSRRRLAQQDGIDLKSLENELDAYVVIAPDGSVITVGHRYKRIARH